ncbi:4Fe-4S binding protein [Candidatus Latescibacterota bacterium]
MIIIDRQLCDVCGTCVGVCPVEALNIQCNDLTFDSGKCTDCSACVLICPIKALSEEA